jgi:hypothetical protein
MSRNSNDNVKRRDVSKQSYMMVPATAVLDDDSDHENDGLITAAAALRASRRASRQPRTFWAW